ncbi:MAG: NAD(P)-binding protein [Chloroflexi bacterium]|nr:NAD(P)-binding protein [Chloroflexota bacterium]
MVAAWHGTRCRYPESQVRRCAEPAVRGGTAAHSCRPHGTPHRGEALGAQGAGLPRTPRFARLIRPIGSILRTNPPERFAVVAREVDVRRRVQMRQMSPDVAVTTFDEHVATYTPEEAMAEAGRALEAGFDLEAAKGGCPFRVDIPAYVRKVADGDFDGALAIIKQSHPFPSVFGRMCHWFCERATPALVDIGERDPDWKPPEWKLAAHPDAILHRKSPQTRGESVQQMGDGRYAGGASGNVFERPNLLMLERFVGDYGDPSRTPFVQEKPLSGAHIAVIGAGSGGLAAAWMLRRLGHEVDIYDALDVPGGMLWQGYPPFRMAKFGVRRDNDPTAWGARYVGGRYLSKEELARIIDEHDYTFLAVGASHGRRLYLPAEDAEGVWLGLDFITQVSIGHPPQVGKHCIVLGAGSTAHDAARTARRLGCAVQIFYRRSVEQMPVGERDPWMYVRNMEREGIEYRFLANPVRILTDEGNRVTGVEFVRMELGELDESGRSSVYSIPDSSFVVACDLVVEAVGEELDLSILPDGIQHDGAEVFVDRADHRTTHPKVFAGGDLIGDKGNDGAALAGIQAAHSIDSLVRGEPVKRFDSRPLR